MKLLRQNLRRRQNGTALVEAAVVSPLLLFLLLLTAEVTNIFVAHNTLTKAVRNGARYAAAKAYSGTTGVVSVTPQLLTEVRNLVVFGAATGAGTPVLSGLTLVDVQVIDAGNDNVSVTATYAYTGILGGTLPSFGFGPDSGLTHNLQATVMMRAL
jgi:Flp pilus assembly protein TadG